MCFQNSLFSQTLRILGIQVLIMDFREQRKYPKYSLGGLETTSKDEAVFPLLPSSEMENSPFQHLKVNQF